MTPSVDEFFEALKKAVETHGREALKNYPEDRPRAALVTFYPKSETEELSPDQLFLGYKIPKVEEPLILTWGKLLETYPDFPRQHDEKNFSSKKFFERLSGVLQMIDPPKKRNVRLPKGLLMNLRSLVRLTEVVTHDHFRILMDLASTLGKQHNPYVYHPIYGAGYLSDLSDFYNDTTAAFVSVPKLAAVKPQHYSAQSTEEPKIRFPENFKPIPFETFLKGILADKHDPETGSLFYIIFDADRYVESPESQALLREMLIQAQSDIRIIKMVILITTTPTKTPMLDRYKSTIVDPGPRIEDVKEILSEIASYTKQPMPPDDVLSEYVGLTEFEIQEAAAICLISTKKSPIRSLYDRNVLADYRQSRGLN